ncbi:MAG: Fe-S cluster assembly protein SufD [Pirellulaceae bacterium]|nr:Fe-S cluster assembly protein SufD [Pirellulaceae bacterium]
MTIIAIPAAFDAASFNHFLGSRNEPDWLTQRRRKSWAAFESTAWPDRKTEEWMRSDLRGFHLDQYMMPGLGESSEDTCPQWLVDDVITCGQLGTIDGRIVLEQLSTEVSGQGVYFGSLEKACQSHGKLVEQHLFSVVDPNADRFAMLHAATWSSGCFLHVPKGVSVEQPFHIHSGMSDGGTDVSHVLLVLEENTSATVLYESSSTTPNADGFHCGGLEIVLKQGASLRLVILQEWGDRVWHFAHQHAKVGRDATIQWTLAAMGARFVQVAQQVSLVGEGARSQVNGTMFTRDKQQMTFNTLQFHEAPNCKSDFLYKAALQDRSRTVWRGMIKVAPGADKTDGYQRNDNLILSDHARADSIPGLEIKADDVRCTHGSTSGRVDDELIFYAQSRGFTRQEAVRMIVTGFFQQIFDRITIESVRKALGSAIARQVRQYE